MFFMVFISLQALARLLLPDVDVDALFDLVNRMLEIFDDPEDLKAIMGLMKYPEISENFGNLASAMAAIDPKHLKVFQSLARNLTSFTYSTLKNLLMLDFVAWHG